MVIDSYIGVFLVENGLFFVFLREKGEERVVFM